MTPSSHRSDRWTPLHVAAHHGSLLSALVLKAYGSSVEAKDRRGYKPEVCATMANYTGVAEELGLPLAVTKSALGWGEWAWKALTKQPTAFLRGVGAPRGLGYVYPSKSIAEKFTRGPHPTTAAPEQWMGPDFVFDRASERVEGVMGVAQARGTIDHYRLTDLEEDGAPLSRPTCPREGTRIGTAARMPASLLLG